MYNVGDNVKVNMCKFLIKGNKKEYRMETTDERTAWRLARLELRYRITGNTRIDGVERIR